MNNGGTYASETGRSSTGGENDERQIDHRLRLTDSPDRPVKLACLSRAASLWHTQGRVPSA
jgi:hypothetical protein